MPDSVSEIYYTPAELASRWSVTPLTLRRWRKAGKLKASFLGHGVRFASSEVERFESDGEEIAKTTKNMPPVAHNMRLESISQNQCEMSSNEAPRPRPPRNFAAAALTGLLSKHAFKMEGDVRPTVKEMENIACAAWDYAFAMEEALEKHFRY